MIRKVTIGLLSGVVAGTLVGEAEALWVLSSAGAVSDYVALFYAAVLYAGIGAGMGLAVGVGLAVLSKITDRVSEPLAYALGFFGVFAPLGLVISRYIANKVIYAEAGVPMSGNLTLLAVFGGISLVGLFLVPILLTKTPLRILLQPKGSLALWGAIAVISAAFSFAPGGGGAATLTPEKQQGQELATRPDVLLIVVDTLRADHLGAYGYPVADISPNIDALAKDSLLFEESHAQASWTRASFASLYTSMLPSAHNTALKVSVLPDDVETIAEVLSRTGYVTGGMPNNTNVTQSFNFHQGFDSFKYLAPNMPFFATESVYQLSMYSVLRKVGERFKGDHKVVEDFYQPANVVVDEAKSFIDAQGQRRWFLMIHFMDPHDPYFEHPWNGKGYGRAEHERPDPADVEYLKATYDAEIRYMDAEMKRLFDWLKETGRYNNTAIVLTADHGEEFYEHQGWWHGTTLYEEQINVPLIVKLPNQELAGARVPWTVRSIDVAPTLAALAGAQPSPMWQGESLLEDADRAGYTQLLAPPAPPAPPVDPAAPVDPSAPPAEPAAPAFDPTKLARTVVAEEDFEGNQITAVIQGGWKYIVANDGNPRGLKPEELYDLGADPDELSDQAGKNGEKQVALSAILAQELAAAKGEAVKAQDVEIDAATRAQMEALGYMEGEE